MFSIQATLQLLLLAGPLLLVRAQKISANEEEAEYNDQLIDAAPVEEENRFLFAARPPRVACACINPFLGTRIAYIGDQNITCTQTKACYVSCHADCADLSPARNWGRCYSQMACSANLTLAAAAAVPAAAAAAAVSVPAAAAAVPVPAAAAVPVVAAAPVAAADRIVPRPLPALVPRRG
jgi:hypothetical protein